MSELLLALAPGARRLVTPELASGDLARHAEDECGTLLAPMRRDISLAALDHAVHEQLRVLPRGDARADVVLGPMIHRCLPLTRREAADPGVFRYLAVIRHPELVRHRWEYRSFATMLTRFWRPGTRHDANAFSRWWWIAELTRDGDDYTLTRRVFERSALATHVFSRDIASVRRAVDVITRVLGDAPSGEVEVALKSLGKMLSVYVLEALPDEELELLVRRAAEIHR